MGLYTHDLTDEDIARLAASPLNCVISYQALSRETMDKMLAHGIRTIYTAGFWKEDSKKGGRVCRPADSGAKSPGRGTLE